MKYRGAIGYEVTVPKETGSDVYISQIEEPITWQQVLLPTA